MKDCLRKDCLCLEKSREERPRTRLDCGMGKGLPLADTKYHGIELRFCIGSLQLRAEATDSCFKRGDDFGALGDSMELETVVAITKIR